MKKLFFSLIIVASFTSVNVSAFDNKNTHRELTLEAIENSYADSYLKENLILPNGTDTYLNGIQIINWLQSGAYLEDEPMCRASNHFHNPRNDLSWEGTFTSTPPGSAMSDQPWFINWWCSESEYPPWTEGDVGAVSVQNFLHQPQLFYQYSCEESITI